MKPFTAWWTAFFSSNIYAAIKSCTSNKTVIIISRWVFALFYSTGEVKQIKSDLSLICTKTCSCVEKTLRLQNISVAAWLIFTQIFFLCVCHSDLDCSLNKMCSAGGGQHKPAIALKNPAKHTCREGSRPLPWGMPSVQTADTQIDSTRASLKVSQQHVSVASSPGCATANVFSEWGICHQGGP